MMVDALTQVATLFLIMVIGYAAAKGGMIDPDMRKRLCDLMVTIAVPLQIISSFQFEYSDELLQGIIIVAGGFFTSMLVTILIGWLVWRHIQPDSRKAVLWYALAFGNTGFMGIPVMEGVLGSTGVIYTSICVAVFNLLAWSVGVAIFVRKTSLKQLLSNTCLWAVVVGLFFFVTRIPMPTILAKTCDMLGSVASPLIMLVLGAVLAECRLRDLFSDRALYVVALFQLIIFPATMFGVMQLVTLPPDIEITLVLLSGMPAATNTVIMASSYQGDVPLSSRAVALSTLLFPVTVLPWMALMI